MMSDVFLQHIAGIKMLRPCLFGADTIFEYKYTKVTSAVNSGKIQLLPFGNIIVGMRVRHQSVDCHYYLPSEKPLINQRRSIESEKTIHIFKPTYKSGTKILEIYSPR